MGKNKKNKKKTKDVVSEEKDTKKLTNEKEEVVEEETKSRTIVSKLIILLLFVGIIFIYARYVGTVGLKIREYNIVDENIPTSFDGFSIVQFSDLEFNTTFTLDDFDKMVDKINEIEPDIVVFTGDLIKPTYRLSSDESNRIVDALQRIDPLIGKYSIRGDDDIKGSSYDILMSTGEFKDITNSYELIYYKGLVPIVIYGLGSSLTGTQDYATTFSYPSIDEDTTYMASYRILLAHEPDTIKSVEDYNISLMLSGHSHNSELNIPYIKNYYNIRGASDYYDSEYKVNSTELYVSSGLGTSKLKLRLFSKPSISVYRLYTE